MNPAWALLAICLGPVASAEAQSAAVQAAHVVVLDFVSAGSESIGRELADSVRLHLARRGGCDVIDAPTTREASGPPRASGENAALEPLMERLAANVALTGTVRVEGRRVMADVRLLDRRDPNRPVTWVRSFSDETQRAKGVIAAAIAEAAAGGKGWRPPAYGDEPEPEHFGPSLNANGDFESTGAGWEGPDCVATFLADGPEGRGKVLRIRTDLKREPYLEYRHRLLLGQADSRNPPAVPSDGTYSSLAGTEGVHYSSDWIRARAGQRYWLTAEVWAKAAGKGGSNAKVFVKGFRDVSANPDGLSEQALAQRGLTPQAFAKLPAEQRASLAAEDAKAHPERHRREVYRWSLSCGGESGGWVHAAAPFPPRGGLPGDVEWLRIEIFAAWPAGEYCFDRVHLYADPRQSSPLPEVPARTPGTSRQNETQDR
jgi:TolB-like protein